MGVKSDCTRNCIVDGTKRGWWGKKPQCVRILGPIMWTIGFVRSRHNGMDGIEQSNRSFTTLNVAGYFSFVKYEPFALYLRQVLFEINF